MRDVTAKITVLVDIARDGSSLPALVRSLDSQTLPVADFEVVWAVDPAATDVRDLVADLCPAPAEHGADGNVGS